jgi:hypothetical protein
MLDYPPNERDEEVASPLTGQKSNFRQENTQSPIRRWNLGGRVRMCQLSEQGIISGDSYLKALRYLADLTIAHEQISVEPP